MAARACILGCLGLQLSPAEKAFFRDANPWGFILFARNIDTPEQLRALTTELRATVGRDVPILLDQEGGRVQRLRAPHWREWTPALEFVASVGGSARAMTLRYQLIAQEMRDVGIDVNCAPMLDVATDASHEIILNRCYGRTPEQVARMGRAVADGLLAGGVLPIIKHIPGHGRTPLDSHFDLPRIETPLAELQATDFVPFSQLCDLPMAMTAHIVYTAIDPDNCATHSAPVVEAIRNTIGFGGLLMTDDLSMKALAGSFAQRAKTSLQAGCDMILHCNGDRAEMNQILSETPELTGPALSRAARALDARIPPQPINAAAALAELEALTNAQ